LKALASKLPKEEAEDVEDTLVEKMIKIAEDCEATDDTILLGTKKLC
jgi:hypothetical protein